jgi:RND family efflux transporter MFP subunit
MRKIVFSVGLAAVLAPFGAIAAEASAAAVVTVAYREVPDMVSAQGVVEAVRQSTLASQVAGQIVALPVQAGDRVKAGQVLARIDPRAAEQAVAGSQSQVAEARAGLANATQAYKRSEQLFAQKFLSKAALDQAELDFKAARARVDALLAQAGQASTAKSFTVIAAPYSGVVATRSAEVGDMATPGVALLSLFDPAGMRVVATLAQSTLGGLKLQLPVQVEAGGVTVSVPAARVTVVPFADSRSHTAKVRLELGDTPGLLPGQYARVWFAAGTRRKLLVPERAVVRRSELTAVYVQDATGHMQLRQVRLGEGAPGGAVEVLSGLRDGEHVALDPVRAGMAAGAFSPVAR